jgi:hypothetical protein
MQMQEVTWSGDTGQRHQARGPSAEVPIAGAPRPPRGRPVRCAGRRPERSQRREGEAGGGGAGPPPWG